jgi:uroporphyrinogen III methyltransferase/synthase
MELTGKRVVVTRNPEQAGSLQVLLEESGASVVFLPTISIEPPPSWDAVDDSIRQLATGEFEWVAFTSRNGAERFFSRLGCMPGEVFTQTKVAAVGSTTAAYLREHGVGVDLVPESYSAKALAEALGRGTGRVLLPRAADVPPDMELQLTANGWKTHEVAAYRTVPATAEGAAAEQVRSGSFDIVTFTSASTVRGFAGMMDLAALGLRPADPPTRVVACIGPVTASECELQGLRADVVADEHTAAGLIHALTMAT